MRITDTSTERLQRAVSGSQPDEGLVVGVVALTRPPCVSAINRVEWLTDGDVRHHQWLGPLPQLKIRRIMEKFLERAIGVALTSTCRHKHGAVIVRHGKVLGASPNKSRNNPRYVDWTYASIHAEIAALKRAGWPRKATVYVARVNGLGQPRLSKPCANCQAVLDEYRIKVVHT
jgi:tRNA(Arg) A34 adenosine deaminase TadA